MSASAFSDGDPVATFFVARTPLLPFDDLLALGDGLRARGALGDDAALESAIAHDLRSVRARLKSLLDRPEIQEALFLASPDLVDRLAQVRFPEAGGRTELAVARYVFRMCGRPTPFGLFAGFTVGSVGGVTSIDIVPLAKYARHARLDNDYLFTLVDHLERATEFAAALRFAPNTSLYKAAGAFRYAETRLDGKSRTNHLVAVMATDYLEATLEYARAGATVARLVENLAATDPEISVDEARAFIDELVENQVLVPDLAPPVTGQEPLDGLVDRLSHLPASAARGCLEEFRSALEVLAGSPLGIPRASYAALAGQLESLPLEVELSRFLQVDLIKHAVAASLGPEPLAEIVRGVELLWRIAPDGKESAITRFAGAFFERYEGREVPLMEALDEDLGLEFSRQSRSSGGAAPLLDGLNFRAAHGNPVSWTLGHELLHRRLVEVLAEGRDEWNLESSDIETLQQLDPSPLPAAFSVMATVGASSSAAVSRGEFDVVLRSAAGPSGANLLGRFCHAEPELAARVIEHLRSEELHAPNSIFAEIVHLPEGRVGNIIARPRLRKYEIPYLGCSSAHAEHQIPVTDLTLAVENRRLILRSRRFGREVIPRLTSAHNSSRSSLPIYRFLAALQMQGTTSWLSWSWGPLSSSPFVPRVRSGRLILSAAAWHLSKADAARFRGARGAQRFRLVQEWRDKWRLPRFVLLADGDNRLPLDLDNVLSVEMLIDLAGRAFGATLQEMIPGPEALLAAGPEGRFVHELIVPFARPLPSPAKNSARPRSRSEIACSFQPGTEWLYAKLYTSEANADRVLREVVAPLRRMALDAGVADRWFFLRYADPEHHVRVRFRGDPRQLSNVLIPALRDATEPMLRDRTLWRVQLDTYERETERYGGDEGMILAERLFFEDSEAALELLGWFTGEAGAKARWSLALAGIDQFLNQFGFDVAAKRSVISALRDGTARDVAADKRLRIQLGDRFRAVRRDVERLLEGARDAEDALREGIATLNRRSERIKPIAAELTSLARAERLTQPLSVVVSSYVHMFINRLMRSQQKRQEFVLYDYLSRIYDSQMARGRTT